MEPHIQLVSLKKFLERSISFYCDIEGHFICLVIKIATFNLIITNIYGCVFVFAENVALWIYLIWITPVGL